MSQEPRSLFREYLEALLIAVIFATFARTWVFQAFKIPSGSMEENLLIGDHILVNKFVYGPVATPLEHKLLPQRAIRHGDVVVFKFPVDPARDFIKRCVGLPGDVLELDDKELFLNGKQVQDESYVYHIDPQVFPHTGLLLEEQSNRDNFGPITVPAGEYFCMGDNRDNSHDSRFWGGVPAALVKGRALLIYWSFESEAGEYAESRSPASKLKQLGKVALEFFSKTRWTRTFRIVR